MDESRRSATPAVTGHRISRRQMLSYAGGMLGLGGSLGHAQRAAMAQSTPPTRGGTLVAAGEAIGDNFGPAVSFQGWAHVWVVQNVFESLYTTRDFKTFIPSLATSYTVSDDGRVYTFQLRKGVKFHDGTPFNAEAVEFNYMRYLDKNHPYFEPAAVQATSLAMLPQDVKSVNATDEHTVQIVRANPMTAFLAHLSTSYGGIMSPTSIKKHGVRDVGRYPVGTGPFVFEKAEKGNQASIAAFDGYWGGRPYLDRVVVRVISDERTMTASLLSGEVDLTPFIDYKDLASFRMNPNLRVHTVPAASTGYMAVNQLHPAMKDLRVRRAVCHAVDKQKIIDVIFHGEADLGAGFVPLSVWGYAPELKDYYKYDPQRAKDLLKEAGGPPPQFSLYTQDSGFWPRLAELMQADLTAVGFKVPIEKINSAKFYGLVTEGKHALYIGDMGFNVPEPQEQFFGQLGCDNPRHRRWGYCDKKWDELLAQQAAERNQEKRRQTVFVLQKMLLDAVTHVANYYNRFSTVTNKRVEGFVPMPVRNMYFHKVHLTKI
jgi:peptide/nickel transport system substrate-binding protein